MSTSAKTDDSLRTRPKRLPRRDPYANLPRKPLSLPQAGAPGTSSPSNATVPFLVPTTATADTREKWKAETVRRRPMLGVKEKESLLAAVVRDAAAFKDAAALLRSEHFGPFEQVYSVCWAVARTYVERGGRLPGKAALAAAVEDAADANPKLLNDAEREQALDLVDWAYDVEPESWSDWRRTLRWLLEERLAARAAEALKPPESQMLPADLSGVVAGLAAEAARIAMLGSGVRAVSLADALSEDPDPRYAPEVISGYLRRGELMNLIAAPKVGKSWVSLSLAVAVASGKRWCGREVRRGRVLLIDGELPRAVLMARAKAVMAAMGVTAADVANRLDFVTARGTTLGIQEVIAYATANGYDLIILDPLYRMLQRGQSEIEDAAMRELYDGLLRVTAVTGCAMLVVHHLPKGEAWKRSTIDSGAGSNVSARSADTHAVLRWADDGKGDAATDGVITLTASCRTFPSPEPAHLRRRAGDAPILEPVEAEEEGGETQPEGRALLEAMKFADRCARPDPETKLEILARADNMVGHDGKKLSRRSATHLFAKCLTAGYIVKGAHNQAGRYRRVPNPAENISSNLTAALESAATAEGPGATPR